MPDLNLLWGLLKKVKPAMIQFINLTESRANCLGEIDEDEPFHYWECKIDPEKATSEKVQIFVLLHEILHSYPLFKGKSDIYKPNEKIEKEIDHMALDILVMQPRIAEFLQNIIREAKIIQNENQY